MASPDDVVVVHPPGTFTGSPSDIAMFNPPAGMGKGPARGTDPGIADIASGMGELIGMMVAPEVFGGKRIGTTLVEEGLPMALKLLGKRTVAAAGGAAGGRIVVGTAVGAPPSVGEAVGAAKQGATGELLGQVLAPTSRAVGAVPTAGGRKVVNKLAGPPSPYGRQAAEMVGKENMTAAQLRNSPALNTLEESVASAPLSGPLHKARAAGQAKLGQAAEDLKAGLSDVPATREQAGRRFQQALEQAHTQARTDATGEYQKVDQLAQANGTQVSLQPLLDRANAEADKRGEMAMAIRGGQSSALIGRTQRGAAPPVDPTIEQANQYISSTAGPENDLMRQAMLDAGIPIDAVAEAKAITFTQAHHLRSALGAASRSADPTTRGVAKQLFKALDQSMTDAASTTPGLRAQYDLANAKWKGLVGTYQKGALARVAKQDPEQVVNGLLRGGRADKIAEARDAVMAVDPAAWKRVQYAHAADLLQGPDGGLVTGEALSKKLTKLTPETLNEIYPQGKANGLWQFARVSQQLEQGAPSESRRVWLMTSQGLSLSSAVGAAMTGHLSPMHAAELSSTIVLGPALLSRILTNPAPRKALIESLATALKDPGRSARLAGQVLAWVNSESGAGQAPPKPPATPPARAQGAGPVGAPPPAIR